MLKLFLSRSHITKETTFQHPGRIQSKPEGEMEEHRYILLDSDFSFNHVPLTRVHAVGCFSRILREASGSSATPDRSVQTVQEPGTGIPSWLLEYSRSPTGEVLVLGL